MQDCHLVVFMKLVCLDDPNSYAGGGVAPGRFNHAGVVKGEKPDKGQPLQVGGSLFQVLLFALRTSFRIASLNAWSRLGWGLGVGLITPPCKKSAVYGNRKLSQNLPPPQAFLDRVRSARKLGSAHRTVRACVRLGSR